MNLEKYIREIPDFPVEGILFKDISTLIREPEAFRYTISKLSESVKDANKIVGIDARGFIFAAAIAYELGLPLIMMRKVNKLPGATERVDYKYEYASGTLEIQTDAISQSDRVVIVDDILATGHTLASAITLVEKQGGIVVGISCVAEIASLQGRDNIPHNIAVECLVSFAE